MEATFSFVIPVYNTEEKYLEECIASCLKQETSKVEVILVDDGSGDECARICDSTIGWTPTEGEMALRNAQGESEAELRRRTAEILPMGRMCERNDYMEGLIYLMSDASAMMTGSMFRLTAGENI